MSVATKNPFALLEADDSSRPPSPAPAAPAPAAPPAPARTSQKPRGGPAARGGKYYARGGANKPAFKDANPNQNGVEEPAAAEGQRKFEARGRGRGGRGGAQRGGRRPFDKHSQTGKTDSDKKIQQSWGGADGNTELKVEEAAVVDATAEANEWTVDAGNNAEWDTPAQDGAADPAPAAEGDKADGRPRREKEPEEEDNTLTLDQYLAQQKEKESIVPKLETTRQANEGADSNIWKDAVPLSKADEDSYFVGKTKTVPKARAKKEEKQFIEIDARFERPDRGGRGRGGRGGDRGGDRARGGGRGRGGARGNRPTAPLVVNVDDQTAFPSLS
ncbi:hypothetical protein J132_09850 [Termitomyces sp. J132]|nr:hypothetical protein H2248_000810 [Termitomyces sp. 'cryptogamus']KNZ71396.1 hypothetical protein J132_09850 [Termitomyces sp. J132]